MKKFGQNIIKIFRRDNLSFTNPSIRDPELVVLYKLIRTDMASMSSGRVAAQSGHASTQFEKDFYFHRDNTVLSETIRSNKDEWNEETSGGFGTELVLDCPKFSEIQNIVERSKTDDKVFAGMIHDPEYFVQDGTTGHIIAVDTCAYLFGRKKDCHQYVGHLKLLFDDVFINRAK